MKRRYCDPAATNPGHAALDGATTFAPRNRTAARGRLLLIPWCAFAIVTLSMDTAQSQPVAESTSTDGPVATGPWTEGVSAGAQRRARALFDQGNLLMETASPARAAARYKQALALWDHPIIHFNLGMAQRLLDQLVAAHASLPRSMQHGPAAIGKKQYQHARKILTLLESQLGHIEVVCAETGARVTLDGKLLFIGPGHTAQFVRAGEHQITASKKGRETYQAPVTLAPGARTRIDAVLREKGQVQTERYLPAWVPWASLAGAAVTLAGAGYLDRRSSDAMDRFDIDVQAHPRCQGRGCNEDNAAELFDRRERAELQHDVAVAMYAVGGAAFVGSAVLLYLNRERVVQRPGREQAEPRRTGGAAYRARGTVALTPILSPSTVGASAHIRF
ncbi:MAG: PEGA domain-containing protein [Proteobacteria bacterium]|nr:PEGA domain-containing protein [Pseudomonadota bacterium]